MSMLKDLENQHKENQHPASKLCEMIRRHSNNNDYLVQNLNTIILAIKVDIARESELRITMLNKGKQNGQNNKSN